VKRLPLAIACLLEREEAERRIGPFFLIRPIGQGGFAPVWLARERYGPTELRVAAVKLFALDMSGAARERIVAEARALCQVEHPNVVRFYALALDEGGDVMGLAMEHVAGTALDARIAAGGRLSLLETLRIGIAVASALSAVHRAGLVHRDVKPANIVEAAGIPKLIDFGIASEEAAGVDAEPAAVASEAGQPTERLFGRAAGTPGYVDPHCARTGARASASSDLYALGATLHECLVGRVPAGLRPGGRLDSSVLEGRAAPPDLREERPDAPASLAELVAAMLAPNPHARPSSADDVAARFERILRGLAARQRALPPEAIGPFRGLSRFEERDRDVFFGRAREIAAALEGLRTRGLVALVGPSGSGKSSLARAGLLPALTEGALSGWPPHWDAAVVEPGRDLRASLTAALDRFVPGLDANDPAALIEALALRARTKGRGLVLLVDPLEALVTTPETEGRRVTAALLSLMGKRAIPGVRAVVAARRDLLDPLLAMDGLGPALARGLVLVEPLPVPALREVIDEALAIYGYTFEDEALGAELTAGIEATAGAMPLVEFALAELWTQRDVAQRQLTRAGLSTIGGVAGALERHAEATLASLDRAGAEAARAVLLSLTTPEGTRAARTAGELIALAGPAAGTVLSTFEAARLVVATPGGSTLAHEALIPQWSRLRRWVDEARDDRRLAEELERDAARRRADPEAVPLWRRRRLAFAEELGRRGAVRLSVDASAFLRASRNAALHARLGVALVSSAIVVSLSGWGLASVRAARAEEEAAQQALSKEQEGRRLADEKRQAVEQKDRQITELAELVHAARTRDESEARIKELRGVMESVTLPPPRPVRAMAARLAPPPPASAAEPPGSAPTSTALDEPIRKW
jgi:hypothetical protein